MLDDVTEIVSASGSSFCPNDCKSCKACRCNPLPSRNSAKSRYFYHQFPQKRWIHVPAPASPVQHLVYIDSVCVLAAQQVVGDITYKLEIKSYQPAQPLPPIPGQEQFQQANRLLQLTERIRSAHLPSQPRFQQALRHSANAIT